MKPERTKESKRQKKELTGNKFLLTEYYLSKKYDFRRNLLSMDIEFSPKGKNTYQSVNENSFYRELQKTQHGIPINVLVSLFRSDFVPEYDPISNFFKKLKWDGEKHIDTLAGYVKAVEIAEWKKHFKKQLVRTVACALDPKYFNKQALILIHEVQNSGKSTFMRFLCPPELYEYIAEDVTTDKDSRILLVKNFMINLDELDKLNKKEIAAVKSFMSKDQINERLPYDRKNSILKRRASFFGSTNNYELLDDPTGSVRWLCFEITSIDFSYRELVDINQVWAEAYSLYLSGEFEFDLTKEEIRQNDLRNKNFQILSVERQLIEKLFEPAPAKILKYFLTATDVLQKLIGLSNIGNRLNVVNVGKALNILGFPKGQETSSRIKGYYLKLKDFDDE